ncbi:MAG: hypothetical protein K1X67_03080 [Fimbriimonadaceae bacterium]|nr:hypothetical protein [Fimbriimonadaceae bacterium]
MRNPLLEPVLIAVIPRWSDAVTVVSKLAVDHAVALADSVAQSNRYREHWKGKDDPPLLVLRCQAEVSACRAAEAVREIAGRNPKRPVSVLVADGPEALGFRESGRNGWNRRFAKALSKSLLDVQVFEYTSSWATHPPRIR